MSEIVLSILIPTTVDRLPVLNRLLYCIYDQINEGGFHNKVEVIQECDEKETPTGTKRNILLGKAKGMYVVFIDSDDHIDPYYVEEIIKATKTQPDAIGMRGWMTTNGSSPIGFFISKDYDYIASVDENGQTIYLRWNNHISPVKRTIATQFKFPDVYFSEDYVWSLALKQSGLIKTEIKIDKLLYHYDYKTLK